jgi:DNA-binding winged helix-turn-helix (wHTH) protein
MQPTLVYSLTKSGAMTASGSEIKMRKFGGFVVDVRAEELYRRGKKVKVQRQPMQVLLALLERPGDVVTRDELREKIWTADTFVDFEHSLNTAIKKLRQALGDRATNSKFVETLPRRGYRFLAAVETGDGAAVPKTERTGTLEGRVFALVEENGTECVLAPVDGKAFEEWRKLFALNDDVGISMMITQHRLLLLETGKTVRMLGRDAATGWYEVRILEGEHYGKTALVDRKTLREVKQASLTR